MARRVLLVVLDSVGVGEAPDAAEYGDVGSNTLSNIAKVTGGMLLPNLARLGLSRIEGVTGIGDQPPCGGYGRMRELSPGKDTTTGHWELAGVVLEQPFPTYPNGFPADVIDAFSRETGRGVLGNCVASGTVILEQLGQRHMETGDLIVYTSADSVFQVAAHVDLVPEQQLYSYCETARAMLQGSHAVGRVIARPFAGQPGSFARTAGRKDFSLPPPHDTVLDLLKQNGHNVMAVGKIVDIFAGSGVTEYNHAAGNPACLAATHAYLDSGREGLIFANLVDFDMMYGHRNDPAGYRRALEEFDAALPQLMAKLTEADLLLITADHGCDPTTASTDHSREYVPLLCWSPAMRGAAALGTLRSFSTVAATVADFFHLPVAYEGASVLPALGLGQPITDETDT